MKNLSLSVIIGLLFSAIGTASLFLTRDPLMAAIWLSFGNGLILSNLRFSRPDTAGNLVAAPVPKIRFYVGIALIVMAVILLGVQVYTDMQQA
ncbi:hypothetical protein K3G39_15855 [Pontibacter sp. HSC-14F20]|uniref:hypothetical protein n=1 Tax=Pontibacter sp. HSC-14F20 TaxID=2864136 RepID=UPI001C73B601|nr:hypothetical protein [Pontibacter sp. HSC-14F20]MBX0334715.1 hypothetical protein [Pontibacter sp. HSC-14F20]